MSQSGAADGSGAAPSSRKHVVGAAAAGVNATPHIVVAVPNPHYTPKKLPRGHDAESLREERKKFVSSLTEKATVAGLQCMMLADPKEGAENCLIGVGLAPDLGGQRVAPFSASAAAGGSVGAAARSAAAASNNPLREVNQRLHDIPDARPNEQLVHNALQSGKITAVYALHDPDAMRALQSKWVSSRTQPVGDIRRYFGEKIALYFAFLGFYTKMLAVPAILGVALYYVQSKQSLVNKWTILYSCVMVLWSSLLVRLWQRRESTLAFNWGTLSKFVTVDVSDVPYDEGTRQFVEATTLSKIAPYFVTVPVTLTMLLLSAASMVGCDYLYFVVTSRLAEHPQFAPEGTVPSIGANEYFWSDWPVWALYGVKFFPTVFYVCVVVALDAVYGKLAVKLTDFEGHRRERRMGSLILKLVSFQFFNNFVSLFFQAFYVQDLQALRTRLATLLIVRAAIQQVQEVAVPLLKGRWRNRKVITGHPPSASDSKGDSGSGTAGQTHFSAAAEARRRQKERSRALAKRAQREMVLEPYNDTYDDILELWVQFGYVTLFASVFPLAAVCALANNLIEIRSDAYKICSARRPIPAAASSLGEWIVAFEFLGFVALVTNLGLVAVSSNMMEDYLPQHDESWRISAIIGVEHLVVLARLALQWIVPSVPASVRVKIANKSLREYEARRLGHLDELGSQPAGASGAPPRAADATAAAAAAGGDGAATPRNHTTDAPPRAPNGGDSAAPTEREPTHAGGDAEGAGTPSGGAAPSGSPARSSSPMSAMTGSTFLSSFASEAPVGSQQHLDGVVVAAVHSRLRELLEDGVTQLPTYRKLRHHVQRELRVALPKDKPWRAWFRSTVDSQIHAVSAEMSGSRRTAPRAPPTPVQEGTHE